MNTLRWVLLIATEVIFWTGLIAFFAFRYGLKRPDLSRLVAIFVIGEHVALFVFGVVDFIRTGTWDLYQGIIAGILVYALIWGRKDLKRLDGWVATGGALAEQAPASRIARQTEVEDGTIPTCLSTLSSLASKRASITYARRRRTAEPWN
jgi:hypothetical protein